MALPCQVARVLPVLLLQHLGGGDGPSVFDIDETLERRRGANTRARAVNRKLRMTVPSAEDALTMQSRTPAAPGAQRIGVVGAVASGAPHRHVAGIEAMIYEFPQAPMPGESGRQEQAGIGHQTRVVKADLAAVAVVAREHQSGATFLGLCCCYKTIIPDSEEHHIAASGRQPDALTPVDSV